MNSDGDNTVRYAPYLEQAHARILDWGGYTWPNKNIMLAFNEVLGRSPYRGWISPDVEGAFLDGKSISEYPALYEMFGVFMAGLDIEVLWNQIYEESVYNPLIEDVARVHSQTLQDEIDTTIMPKFLAGMRNINSVMTSAFAVGKSIIYDTKQKALSKFVADLRLKMVDITQQRWTAHLNWNKSVLEMYGQYAKLYFSAKMDVETMRMDFATKDVLWDIKLFEYVRAVIGAMQGMATTVGLNEPSQGSKSITGAMSGAAIGAQIGSSSGYGGEGAAVGALVGLAASFA